MNSPADVLIASKEQLDYLDKELDYQTQADLGAETIPEQVSKSGQQQV